MVCLKNLLNHAFETEAGYPSPPANLDVCRSNEGLLLDGPGLRMKYRSYNCPNCHYYQTCPAYKSRDNHPCTSKYGLMNCKLSCECHPSKSLGC